MRRPAAACVLTALVAAGCGGDGPPGGSGARAGATPVRPPAKGTQRPPAPPGDQAQLEALLARRARALEDGDARRYAATSAGPQRREDRRAARDARGLPLRDVRLTVLGTVIDGGRATLDVRSGYAVAGVSGRFEADRTLRAARTAHGWRIRSQSSRRRHHPWEVARFVAERSRHFVVLRPALTPADGLLAALEDGYRRMKGVLPDARLRRRYLVVVAGDARQARRMTAGIRGVASLAAISDTSVREEGKAQRVTRVSSQRLLVVWPAFVPLDADGRRRVVAHELTHASLAGVTSGRTPSWLVEGVALYVSGDRRAASAAQLVRSGTTARAARRALTLTGLSRPDAIGRLGGDGQSAAYAYSSSAAFYIAERFGRGRLFRLYRAFNSESLTGRGPALSDQAVRRALGIPLATLQRDLRGWVLQGGP